MGQNLVFKYTTFTIKLHNYIYKKYGAKTRRVSVKHIFSSVFVTSVLNI